MNKTNSMGYKKKTTKISTIHIHMKHFLEHTELELNQYIMLLMYEQGHDIKLKDLVQYLRLSEREVCRLRKLLLDLKYLEQPRKGWYVLTDKLYPINPILPKPKVQITKHKKEEYV